MILIEFFKGLIFQDYDKSNHDVSLRKKLLLSPPRVSSSGTATAVIQPAATDIYLCDKCENEFYSLREVQIHEKKCCGDTPPSPIPPSPDPEPVEEDPEPAGQVPFLAYFRLQPAEHTGLEPYMSPRKRSSSPPRKLIGPNYPRFDTVPLTSPLGRFLLQNSKFRNKHQASQHLVLRYERHLHATPHTEVISSRDRGSNRWIVVWRPNKEEQPWVHSYSFNKSHRRERRICIDTGLDLRSRRLLALCRPLRVRLKRLQKRVIDRVTRLNCPTAAPCIDLTDDPPRHFPNSGTPGDILPTSAGSPGMIFNGSQEHEDPLRLFDSPTDVVLNVGASSSSWHSSNQPPVLGNSDRSFSLGEYIPVQFHPGDIIKHDSISLFPLLPVGTSQNDSRTQKVVSNAHNLQHQKTKFQSEPVIAPGPLCSKKSKLKLLSNNSSLMQQNTNSHSISKSEVIHMSGGNYDILNRFKGNLKETSVYAISGSGFTAPIISGEASSFQNQFKASVHVNNSQSVPQVSESNSKVLSVKSGVNMRNSSIEVIDLSSDDDDGVKIRGYSEADNAPRQLDGVECYPHAGAQVPGTSSKFSMPKNGNSHWSSNMKSHCDAGRLGDLTTNGQPPNVLRNSADLPVPRTWFLPTTLVKPHVAEPAETTINTRKRRCEEPHFGSGGKLLVLDVSKEGLKVSQQGTSEVSISEKTKLCQGAYLPRLPSEVSHITLQSLDKAQSTFNLKAPVSEGSKQLGAFHCNDSFYQNSNKFATQDHLSVNLHRQLRDENNDLENTSASGNLSQRSSGLLHPKSNADSIEPPVNTDKTSFGLIENIVSTVSKGVEFIRSLVGSPGASSKDNTIDKDQSAEDLVSEKSTQVPKTCSSVTGRASEVERLLGDECRELNRKGLGNLRNVNLQKSKVTRRSVERAIPGTGKDSQWAKSQSSKDRRNPLQLEVTCKPLQDCVTDVTGTSGENMRTSSAPLTPTASDDTLSACMDENGNSPSYVTSKVNSKLKMGVQYEMLFDDNMNNNVSDNNTSELDQKADGNKKNNKYTDFLRRGVDNEFGNQTKVRDENVISVNSSGLRDISDMGLIKNVDTNTLSHEGFCEWKSKYQSELHHSYLHILANERLVGTNTVCENSAHKLGCPVETMGKTAEESGALQAEVPRSSNNVENAKSRYTFETSDPLQLIQNTSRLCKFSSNLTKGDVPNCIDHEIPYYMMSDLESLNPEMIRGSGLCLGLLNLRTEESKQMLMKGFQLDSRTYFSKDGLGDQGDSLSLIKRNTKEDWKKESKGSQLLSVKDDSRSALLTRSMKQKKVCFMESQRECSKLGVGSEKNIDLDQEEKVNDIENLPMNYRTRIVMDKFNGHGQFLLHNDYNVKAPDNDGRGGDSTHHSVTKKNQTNSKFGKIENALEEKMDRRELLNLSNSNKQKRKKGCLRELNNLGCDEWKEMRTRGFHPSDVLGSNTDKVSLVSCESDESDSDGQDSQPLSKRLHDVNKSPDVSQRGKKNTMSHCPFKKAQISLPCTERNHKHLQDFRNISNNRVYLHCDSGDEDCLNNGRPANDLKTKIYDRSPKDKKMKLLNQSPGISEACGGRDAESSVERKPRKRSAVPRELRNLGRDEWKEMRNTGFHPSDLVGSESTDTGISYLIGESDEDEDYSDCTENEPPVIQQHQGKKCKMSREVLRLLKDECKELKQRRMNARDSSRHKRRIKGLDSGNDRHLRGNSNVSRTSQYANLILKSSYNMCNSKYLTDKDITNYANVRNTRSQTNVVSFVEVFTPRDSHRQLLHSETAMCVLNYDLPSIS